MASTHRAATDPVTAAGISNDEEFVNLRCSAIFFCDLLRTCATQGLFAIEFTSHIFKMVPACKLGGSSHPPSPGQAKAHHGSSPARSVPTRYDRPLSRSCQAPGPIRLAGLRQTYWRCRLMSNQTMKTGTMALETVKEREFTFDHPEVGKHTDMFFGLQKRANLFDAFDGIQKPSRDLAVVLGTFWCLFSAFMPRFASRAAGMIRDNLKRHFVIQTPFEELGGRDGNQIHADLFVQALQLAGVGEIDFLRWCSFRPIAEALEGLEKSLAGEDTDHEVLGILHGLEIPAEEIIDRLFAGLAHSEDVREALDGHHSSRFTVRSRSSTSGAGRRISCDSVLSWTTKSASWRASLTL